MARIIKATELKDPEAPRMMALRLSEMAAEVRDVVLDARKQAARILAGARDQAEYIQLQAHEKGYSEGFERGRKEGCAEGERRGHELAMEKITAETAGLVRLGQSVLDELARADGVLRARQREQVLELAVAIAERIVGRIAPADIASARANLMKALELAGRTGLVRILVNPSQLEALRRHCTDLVQLLGRSDEVELIADEGISAGGVRLVVGVGEIDATIETQLNNIAQALVGRRSSPIGTYSSALAAKPAAPPRDDAQESFQVIGWKARATQRPAGAPVKDKSNTR